MSESNDGAGAESVSEGIGTQSGGEAGVTPAVPLISCICPTYNRAPDHLHLLEEAVESFLRQDYPNKELVILNDTPGQELTCDAPGVRIINAPERYPSLGEKRNALVAAARGDYLANWDDDDISLPWRLSLSMERLGSHEYFESGNYWYYQRKNPPDPDVLSLDHQDSLAMPSCIFTRAGFEAVGGYPAISYGEDRAVHKAFVARNTVAPPMNRQTERVRMYYIYRRGVSPVHMYGRLEDAFYQVIGERPVVTGTFAIRPRWRTDYVEATRRVLAETPRQAPQRPRAGDVRPAQAPAASPGIAFTPAEEVTPPAELPLISCICATYNRPPSHIHLLEEAIESFLRQDYPNKELIIVNDTPGQSLLCAAPNVKILNANFRFRSIGDKHNTAIAAASGSIIAVWDDDDISLPWRLSNSLERLGEADYFNPGNYWFIDSNGLHSDHAKGLGHGGVMYRRDAFYAAGLYPVSSLGEDQVLHGALHRHCTVAKGLGGRQEIDLWAYIYRWGVSPAHVSGGGRPEHYEDIGKRPIVAGEFLITPRWYEDYVAMTREHIAGLSGRSSS